MKILTSVFICSIMLLSSLSYAGSSQQNTVLNFVGAQSFASCYPGGTPCPKDVCYYVCCSHSSSYNSSTDKSVCG